MTYETSTIERMIKRDRTIIVLSLTFIIVLSWIYILFLVFNMNNVDLGTLVSMPKTTSWSSTDFLVVFIMWTIMMIAMMVPSAAPMIILFSTISRKKREQQAPYVSTWIFLLGYLVVWTFYSALATLAQWALHTATLLSPMMMLITNPFLTGVLLLIIGIFQFSPYKYACLTQCHSPLQFLLTKWKNGRTGAFTMGINNGNYCLGCCWALMSLLFVVGVMNIIWIAILAIFVLIEKVSPPSYQINRLSGSFIIVWGILVLSSTIF